MDEIELKFLNINVDDIKQKLQDIGAKLKYSTQIESYPFLKEGFDGFDSTKRFLSVRKVDDKITITHKEPAIKNSDFTHREETEIAVDNYEKALLLFEKLGFTKGNIFKKHREHYELGDVHFELDTLENVPTYLEIETQSNEKMIEICQTLNLDITQGKKGTIVEIMPELLDK